MGINDNDGITYQTQPQFKPNLCVPSIHIQYEPPNVFIGQWNMCSIHHLLLHFHRRFLLLPFLIPPTLPLPLPSLTIALKIATVNCTKHIQSFRNRIRHYIQSTLILTYSFKDNILAEFNVRHRTKIPFFWCRQFII